MTAHAERRPRTASSAWGPTTAAIVALMALYAVPLLFVVASSFKTNIDITNNPLSVVFTPTLEPYRTVLTSTVLHAAWNSVLIAVSATAITLGCAVPLAYTLAKFPAKWSAVIVAVLIALQMVPHSTSVIPLYSLLPALGLMGTIIGVALSIAAGTLPYAALLLRPFFLALPREVTEAAQVDGAGPLRTFFAVVLPLVRNGVVVITVLVFIWAWGEFLYSLSFLTNSSQYPLSVVLVQQQGQFGTLYNNLMALSVVGAIPSVILFAFTAKKLTSGLALGAGK